MRIHSFRNIYWASVCQALGEFFSAGKTDKNPLLSQSLDSRATFSTPTWSDGIGFGVCPGQQFAYFQHSDFLANSSMRSTGEESLEIGLESIIPIDHLLAPRLFLLAE